MKVYRIFVINPGSTSTKIALFENDQAVLKTTVEHDARELAQYDEITQQVPYRKETIERILEDNGIVLENIDACVGRGGGLMPVEGGTYAADELLLDHARRGANGTSHPAQLGSLLAKSFAYKLGCPTFVVNPPDVDEYQPLARVTGVKGIERMSHLHALNLKETAIRHAESIGKKYEDCNFIVCHIGGGISVSAHKQGKMVDGNDIVAGEGPIAPTRCGSLSVRNVVALCEKHGTAYVKELCTKTGGFVNLLGTSDGKEIKARIASGDKEAEIYWNAMLYQITKYIGSMAAVLEGKVDGILLGGGMVHDESLVEYISEKCGFIAPVFAYPGEFEMEAMASGAIRVLSGKENAKQYKG